MGERAFNGGLTRPDDTVVALASLLPRLWASPAFLMRMRSPPAAAHLAASGNINSIISTHHRKRSSSHLSARNAVVHSGKGLACNQAP
jgi:hypothetical protein